MEPEVKMSDSVVEWLKVYFDHQERDRKTRLSKCLRFEVSAQLQAA